jgi:hypothetical protein
LYFVNRIAGGQTGRQETGHHEDRHTDMQTANAAADRLTERQTDQSTNILDIHFFLQVHFKMSVAAAHPEPRISPQTPQKIQDGPNGTPKGPGEGDPLKKPEAENPATLPTKEQMVWTMGRNVVMSLL